MDLQLWKDVNINSKVFWFFVYLFFFIFSVADEVKQINRRYVQLKDKILKLTNILLTWHLFLYIKAYLLNNLKKFL